MNAPRGQGYIYMVRLIYMRGRGIYMRRLLAHMYAAPYIYEGGIYMRGEQAQECMLNCGASRTARNQHATHLRAAVNRLALLSSAGPGLTLTPTLTPTSCQQAGPAQLRRAGLAVT